MGLLNNLFIYRLINKFLTIAHCILFSFITVISIEAQENNAPYPRLTIDVKNIPFQELLTIIEHQTSYRFAYNTDIVLKQGNVSLKIQDMPLNEAMQLVFKKGNINFNIIDNQIILTEVLPPPNVTISGYIVDEGNGESLPGAIVYLPGAHTGTYTNSYGFYSITQNQSDSIEMMVSYLGYNRIFRKVSASRNLTQNIFLTKTSMELNTVVVSEHRQDDNIKLQSPGKTDISLEMIKANPSVSGNGDIVNTIQMMPGVMAGLDGRPGYFIRGGNTDQNLVQLDEATLYNPNHLLGLVSVFNSSAIKSAYLLKAGFPASFGDHLSSVLDVTMKDGNNKQFEGDVQAGTITSGITLSGPVIEDKASFFVAARRSTIDLLLKPMDFSNYYSNYNFYDINAKLNFKITSNDRIYVSFYKGNDFTRYSKNPTTDNAIDYQVNFGNQASAIRWNHLFTPKLFFNTSVVYNDYHHQVNAIQNQFYAELYSGIRDVELKTNFNYYPNVNHKITAGIDYNYQTLSPATISDKSPDTGTDVAVNPTDIKKKYCSRLAGHFSDELRITPKLTAYIGGRIPFFYRSNVQYLQFEPRLLLLYILTPTTSIKLSYTYMHQYLHLAQSYNASFPAEVWIGSSKIVKPESSREASLGLFKNFKQNMFRTSVELYYKTMGNQLLFRGNTTPSINSNIDTSLIFGKGKSYGVEVFLEKASGKLTGWISYTLSYSYQQFDSLNYGHEFPFANDRRHSIYLSLSYNLGKHWKVSSNYVYTSGRAFSLFKYAGKDNSFSNFNSLFYYSSAYNKSAGTQSAVPEYGQTSRPVSGPGSNDPLSPSAGSNASGVSSFHIIQNNYRLAPYHRLDVSISYHKTRNLRKRVLESEWVFSVYNVYARKNTFFAYCSVDPSTQQPIAVQVSFVPVIPSISYNLKF